MRKIIFFVALLFCSVVALAQKSLLSPRAAMLLADLNGKYSIGDLDGRYHFVRSQGETYVQAIAMLAEGLDAKVLDAYGIKTGTCVSNRAMVLIPLRRYADVVTSGLCSQIEIAQEVKPLLDRARTELGVDYIHQGLNLPQGYDGTGVVVGVIDIGIEYGHPSFYDSTGTVLRIKRVWQQNDTTGTAPVGFGYGSEYATQEEILSAVTDTVLLSDECLAANSNIYCSVDLTPYVGQIMRVGFRHHATGVFGGMLSLNSIRIEQLQGIGDVADGSGVSVYTVDGRIQVRGAEGMEVRVYDMMGRRVCNEVRICCKGGRDDASQGYGC